MRFALVTQETRDGIPTTVVPITSGELADAVINRIDPDVRLYCENAIRNAFAAGGAGRALRVDPAGARA